MDPPQNRYAAVTTDIAAMHAAIDDRRVRPTNSRNGTKLNVKVLDRDGEYTACRNSAHSVSKWAHQNGLVAGLPNFGRVEAK